MEETVVVNVLVKVEDFFVTVVVEDSVVRIVEDSGDVKLLVNIQAAPIELFK